MTSWRRAGVSGAGLAPQLPTTCSVNPWWKVEGAWPQDYGDFPEQLPPDVLAGSKLAQQAGLIIGDQIEVGGRKLRISGICAICAYMEVQRFTLLDRKFICVAKDFYLSHLRAPFV